MKEDKKCPYLRNYKVYWLHPIFIFSATGKFDLARFKSPGIFSVLLNHISLQKGNEIIFISKGQSS